MNKISLLLLEHLSPPLALKLAQAILASEDHKLNIGNEMVTSVAELDKENGEFRRRQSLNTPDRRGFERFGSSEDDRD
jgi:hypothetical protein